MVYIYFLSQLKMILVLFSGPFTVFAPSDEAFDQLSPDSMRLLSQEDDTFRSILLYHILPGEIPSSQLSNDKRMTSVQGQSLRFNRFDKNDKIVRIKNHI